MNREHFDIEVALKEDASGEYKKLLIAELADEVLNIKQHLNRGVNKQEYEQLEPLLKAAEAASEVVEKVWQQVHVH